MSSTSILDPPQPPNPLEECAVCKDSFAGQDTVCLGCGHCFHSSCGQQWFTSQRPCTCPLCRADFAIRHHFDAAGAKIDEPAAWTRAREEAAEAEQAQDAAAEMLGGIRTILALFAVQLAADIFAPGPMMTIVAATNDRHGLRLTLLPRPPREEEPAPVRTSMPHVPRAPAMPPRASSMPPRVNAHPAAATHRRDAMPATMMDAAHRSAGAPRRLFTDTSAAMPAPPAMPVAHAAPVAVPVAPQPSQPAARGGDEGDSAAEDGRKRKRGREDDGGRPAQRRAEEARSGSEERREESNARGMHAARRRLNSHRHE